MNKKMSKYLKEIRQYRIAEQIERSVFEIYKYFEYFGLEKEELKNAFNSSFDSEEYTYKELKYIYDQVIDKLDKRYYLNNIRNPKN